MSTFRRRFGVGGACALAVAVGPAAGVGQARDDAAAKRQIIRQLVGTWELVSFVARTNGRVTGYPYGRDAVGRLTYTPDGAIWTVVARRNKPKDATNSLWYTGRFRVDLKRHTVIHRVRFSSAPSLEGRDQVRVFRLSGRFLTLATPITRIFGPPGDTVLRWRKVVP